MRRLLAFSAIFFFAAGAFAGDIKDVMNPDEKLEVPQWNGEPLGVPFSAQTDQTMICSSGPLANLLGACFGGADCSRLLNVTSFPPQNVYGWGMWPPSIRIADGCELTEECTAESILVYAYQTGAPTSGTINSVNVALWDGNPTTPGSSIIYGSQSGNVYTTHSFSNTYRDLESAPGATNRAIMEVPVAVSPAQTLSPGVYWIDAQVDGTAASGPWAPQVACDTTIHGPNCATAAHGNALQSTNGGSTWISLTDSGPAGINVALMGTCQPPTPTGVCCAVCLHPPFGCVEGFDNEAECLAYSSGPFLPPIGGVSRTCDPYPTECEFNPGGGGGTGGGGPGTSPSSLAVFPGRRR
jgi:hypothetical protein